MAAEPGTENGYLAEFAALLLISYRHWTGLDLIDSALDATAAARALYTAPFAVLAHDAAPDPLFTYANFTAQHLFEMPWKALVGRPSRLSAASVAREERQRLLARVARDGFIDDYSGVRISASGRRFRILGASVWNLVDSAGMHRGQAARFSRWEPVGAPHASDSTAP